MRTLSVSEVEVVSGGVNEDLTTAGIILTIIGAAGAAVAAVVAAPIAIPLGIASGAALVFGGTAMAAGIGDLSGGGGDGGGRTGTVTIGPITPVVEIYGDEGE
jgi:hypothetical protein